MPRARLLKPQFFDNEELAALDPYARLLFQGLWCLADREGRLEDRPARIKKHVMAYDEVDADALLSALDAAQFIKRYEAGGGRYIQVNNFLKHQHPHPNELPSVIPPMEEALHTKVVSTSYQGEKDSLSDKEALGLDPSSLILDPLASDLVPPVVPQGGHDAKGAAKPKHEMTEEEHQKLYKAYGDLWSNKEIDERCEEAKAHTSYRKATNEYLYLRNWLRNDYDRLKAIKERNDGRTQQHQRPNSPSRTGGSRQLGEGSAPVPALRVR